VALSVPPTAAPPVQVPAVATVVHPTTGAKFAVTMVSAVTDRVQVATPVQPPPDQPVKAEPVAGVAVRVTLAVGANAAEQVGPQLMFVVAAGVDVDVTVPFPVPARTMVRVLVGSEKVAATVVAADIVTVQVAVVPEHPPPDQPANTEPVAAAAVRTTLAPELKEAEQVAPQAIPAGFDVTVPVPDPFLLTVSAVCGAVKVAVTAALPAVRLTEQVPVPEHPAPDHPANVEPAAAVAVRTTGVVVNVRLQAFPQLIPFAPGEVTVPLPVPAFVTVSVALAQAPAVHVGVGKVHATGAPQAPAAEQVCTPLPEHCLAPGAHPPVSIPVASMPPSMPPTSTLPSRPSIAASPPVPRSLPPSMGTVVPPPAPPAPPSTVVPPSMPPALLTSLGPSAWVPPAPTSTTGPPPAPPLPSLPPSMAVPPPPAPPAPPLASPALSTAPSLRVTPGLLPSPHPAAATPNPTRIITEPNTGDSLRFIVRPFAE
jgi:hypothetical protein